LSIIKSLRENAREFKAFVADASVRTSSKSEDYLDIIVVIVDTNENGEEKRYEVKGKKWNASDTDKEYIKKGNWIVVFNYSIDEYKGNHYLTIQKYNLVEKPQDYRKYIKSSYTSPENMMGQFKEIVSTIRDEKIQKLVACVYIEVKGEFYKAPAAYSMHHNYMYGLLEHTVEVAKICESSAKCFIQNGVKIDTDILLAGALMHDMGKVYEYEIDEAGTVSYRKDSIRDIGGHILVVRDFIRKHGKDLEIPQEKLWALEHIVLSHHGKLEWGAVVAPNSVEAIILHLADMASANVHRFEDNKDKRNGYLFDLY
jgi:3'-5' exoribonuclease